MTTVLGIDLGTQSVKAIAYDADLRAVVASHSSPLSLRQDKKGSAEQETDWWLAALREAVTSLNPRVRRSVAALAVSGQQHGFVAVDRNDDVLAPVKLWCDTSTAAECDEIMADFGGRDACIAEVGNPILPGYTASKLRWLKGAHPDRYDRMDGILLPHDYVNLQLTGERCMEAGDASGTGFFDIRSRQWSADMLRAIDPDRDLMRCLPALRHDNESIGKLLPALAEEWGLPAGIPVGIGGGDNMMGAIGTGNLRQGCLTMSLGTSGTVYAYAKDPVIDPEGNIAAFCSSTGGWLPLLCTMNCTVSTELMRGLLGTDIDAFEAQISAAPAGADGVITIPFFNGERTPNLPNSRGCVAGLSGHNATPDNLLRSAVEGATFALKAGIDTLDSLGVAAERIVVTGGGARSATWRQVVADVCNAPVIVLEQDEGAAFGAALQALQLLETGSSMEDIADAHLSVDEARSCEPRDAAVHAYEDHFEEFGRWVNAVTTLYNQN